MMPVMLSTTHAVYNRWIKMRYVCYSVLVHLW